MMDDMDTLYYGHQSYFTDVPIESGNITGFDLGCVYGHKMVAISLNNGKKDYFLASARKVYRNKDKENE